MHLHFQHRSLNFHTNITMASDYSISGASDEEIIDSQNGSRKRRRLSPSKEVDSEPEVAPESKAPVSTISRIKAKPQNVAPATDQKATTHAPNSKDTVSFASIDVAPWLVASLASMEIKKPTGIQKACIPEILEGKDCIGGSRTGTGKTIAFSVPILQRWAEDPSGIFAVIIT